MRPGADTPTENAADTSLDRGLRRQWWLVAAVGLLWVASGAGVVASVFDTNAGVRWGGGAAVIVGFGLATFRYHLPRNHPPDSPENRTDSVGVANGVTLFRGGLLSLVAGFLFVEPTANVAWIPALCYGAAAGLDWVDGRLARYTDQTTVLGARLDMAFDTTGLLVAALVGVRWGTIPVWYLLVPAARYCYRGAVGIRQRRNLPVEELPESRIRRPNAGLQMVFVGGALLPIAPASVVRNAAAIVAIVGIAVFLRDYLAVTRRLG